MKPTEIAHLRGVLEVRRAELEDLFLKREPTAFAIGADMLDQIQHAQETETSLGILQAESNCLSEVRDALRRIYFKTYGMCTECDEEISPKRFAAVPWASKCVACAESMDRNRPAASYDFEGQLLSAS